MKNNFIRFNKKIKTCLIILILLCVFFNLCRGIKTYINNKNKDIYYYNYQDTNFQMGYSKYCYKVNENLYCEVKGKDVPVFWYGYFTKNNKEKRVNDE